MKYFLTTLLFVTSFWTYAQFTKANADIRNAADGATIAVLRDSIKVALSPQENGWYPMAVKVITLKSNVSSDSILTANAELLDPEKNVIGKTSDEIKVEMISAEGRGMHKYYVVLIKGYLKSYKIDYSSIPEVGLEKILNQKSVAGRQEQLESFYKTMGFEKYRIEGTDFVVWAYLDKAGSLHEPMYRTLVIMRSETTVYAIISRHDQMTLEKLKDQKSDHTGNYFFFQRPPANTMKEIENIVYSFIPL